MTTKDQDSIFINNFFDRSAGCSLLKHEGDVCPCIYIYMGVVQKVLVLPVVFDDLWYAKMTFGES